MVSTHRADVDGLDASHTTIVFQLQTREITQGVCHGVRAQPFQLLAAKGLRGNHFPKSEFRGDDHRPEAEGAVAVVAIVILCEHSDGY